MAKVIGNNFCDYIALYKPQVSRLKQRFFCLFEVSCHVVSLWWDCEEGLQVSLGAQGSPWELGISVNNYRSNICKHNMKSEENAKLLKGSVTADTLFVGITSKKKTQLWCAWTPNPWKLKGNKGILFCIAKFAVINYLAIENKYIQDRLSNFPMQVISNQNYIL